MPLFTPEIEFSDDYPTIEPSLKLDFANARALDPRITFTRASTATYVGKDGLIKTAGVNEPRFDHDPATGESLGLLIEEERTNLFQYNNNPTTNASGTATKSTVQIVLPSGETGPALETDADAFAENYRNITATANTNPGYLTFYAKKKSAGSTGTLTITMEGGGTARSFNSASINSDTWTKISTTHDWSSSNSTLRRYDIYFNGSGNTSDGDTSFYVAFQQFEEATFPTSYIPTSGSTVTREVEYGYTTDMNFYNQNEGSVLSEVKLFDFGNTPGKVIWSLNQVGGFGEGIYYVNENGSNNINYSVQNGGSQFSGGDFTSNDFIKSAIGFKKNSMINYFNGSLVGTEDTSGNIPNNIGRLVIGNNAWGSSTPSNALNPANCHIKSFSYYPKRLTNTQLQTLTQ